MARPSLWSHIRSFLHFWQDSHLIYAKVRQFNFAHTTNENSVRFKVLVAEIPLLGASKGLADLHGYLKDSLF